MSDLPRDSLVDPAPRESAPQAANRLGTGHLLLWITMTAVILALLQTITPEKSFAGAAFETDDPQLQKMYAQYRESYRWQHALMLVFSPLHGATLAAFVLALWRLANRSGGFPSQPGHWLLLLLAVLPLVVALTRLGFIYLQLIGGIGLWATIASLAFWRTAGPWRWRLSFGLMSLGLLATIVPLGLSAVLPWEQFLLGVIAISISALIAGSGILAALGASILDLTANERYDVFHWTGTAALFGLIGQFFALRAIDIVIRS